MAPTCKPQSLIDRLTVGGTEIGAASLTGYKMPSVPTTQTRWHSTFLLYFGRPRVYVVFCFARHCLYPGRIDQLSTSHSYAMNCARCAVVKYSRIGKYRPSYFAPGIRISCVAPWLTMGAIDGHYGKFIVMVHPRFKVAAGEKLAAGAGLLAHLKFGGPNAASCAVNRI